MFAAQLYMDIHAVLRECVSRGLAEIEAMRYQIVSDFALTKRRLNATAV